MQIVGIFLPPVIDLINKHIPHPQYRFWVSFLFCTVVGAIVYYFSYPEMYTFEGVGLSITSVFGLAQLSYKGVYEKSVLQDRLR